VDWRRLQGNADWDSEEHVRTRQALRSHPSVIREINRFWQALSAKDMKHGLQRQAFIDMHLKVSL